MNSLVHLVQAIPQEKQASTSGVETLWELSGDIMGA